MQYDFIPNRGTIEAITALKTVIMSRMNQQLDTCIAFVDFQKAFDMVDHCKLMGILQQRGVTGECLRVISNLYIRQKAYMRGYHNLPLEIARGVRQGCALSPTLYNTYADEAFATLDATKVTKIGQAMLNRIMYADDTAIVAACESNLKELLEDLVAKGSEYGIKVNVTKTKYMVVNRYGHGSMNISIHGQRVGCVSHFKYLGVTIRNDGRDDNEIKERIAIVKQAFWHNSNLMRSYLKIKTKIKVLKAYIWSIMRYGCEVWELKNSTEKSITAFEMWGYKRILKISWIDRITNEDVLRRMKCDRRVLLDQNEKETTQIFWIRSAGALRVPN